MLQIFIRQKGAKEIEVVEFNGEVSSSLGSFPSQQMARAVATSASKKEQGSQVFNLVNDVHYVGPMKSRRYWP